MTYTNVIFDFDGTITDSKRDIARSQLWVLNQLGVHSYRESDLYRHIGKTLEETFADVLPPRMHSRIKEAAELYAEYYPGRSLQTTTLFPGVRESLQRMRSRGLHLAVASTKRGPGILRATNHFQITELFDRLQGSEGLPFKPDPAVINAVIDGEKWDRARTIMVGDTGMDILAGKGAGVATCGVTYGSLSAAELRAFGPDFIIDEFPALLPILGLPPLSLASTHEPR